QLDELRILSVVDGDLAAEAEREPGRDEALDGAPPRPAAQAGGDEDRLAVGRHSESLELLGGGDDGHLTRIAGRRRDRQPRRLAEERRPGAAADERLERRSRERKAERVADGRADVGDRPVGRRGRGEHDRVVRGARDDHPRAVQERDTPHYGIARYIRRNVVRNPRAGQKRDERRFVTRQSVTITGYLRARAHSNAAEVSVTPAPVPRASGRVIANPRKAAFGTSARPTCMLDFSSGTTMKFATTSPSTSATRLAIFGLSMSA